MSRLNKFTALIIHSLPLGEADLLVTAFTSRGNLVKFVAKGARKTKSRLAAAVQPFVLGSFIIYRGRSLPILRQGDIMESFGPVRRDLVKTMAALSALEICRLLVAEEGGEEEVFAHVFRYLSHLKQQPFSRLAYDSFRLQLVGMLGYGLALEGCVGCDQAVPAGWLVWDEGGLMCKTCAEEQTGKRHVAGDILSIIRHLARVDFTRLGHLTTTPGQRQCCGKIVDDLIFWVTDGKTKAQTFSHMLME